MSKLKIPFLILIIGAALTAASYFLDDVIILWLRPLHNPVFDWALGWLTQFRSLVFVLLVIPTLFLWESKKKGFAIPLWLGFGTILILETVLKFVIDRRRPFDAEGTFGFLGESSFPSGHTSVAFTLAFLVSKAFPKLAWFWYLIAAAIGLSRLYFELHYLSDVIGGAAIGLATGAIIFAYTHKPKTDVHQN